jgi:hypothetical protein
VTASARFVVQESTQRDREQWPWLIRDMRRKQVTAKCSNEATARSVVDRLNQDDARRDPARLRPGKREGNRANKSGEADK